MTRTVRRAAAMAVACAFLAACGASRDDVDATRADQISATSSTVVPSTVLPSTTVPPIPSPPVTAPIDPLDDDVEEPQPLPPPDESEAIEFGTGLDDALFPGLGAPGVDVLSYDVVLDVDVVAGAFDAVVEIEVDVAAGIDKLALDAEQFDVSAVEVDGAGATFEQTATDLIIDLPVERSDVVTARIVYAAAPDGGRSAVGLPAGWFTTEDGAYVLNEPDGARTWLPSNDHPSDKAQWRFEITAAAAAVVSANGTLVQRGGGDVAWVWQGTDPMPTYLVHLVIGDYELIEAEPVVMASGDPIPLTHLVPIGSAESHQPFFDQTQPQFDFFEERFGPYPLSEYGLAFIDSPPGLAMETQGRSLFSAEDFDNGELGSLQQLFLAHELAHQWFGNSVSPAAWSDLWLNESFSTYSEWLWLDEVDIAPLDVQANAALARRQDGPESTGQPTVENLFGYERYGGGAAVVHALRLELGDGVFFALLRGWLTENAGTSQTTAAFIDRAEREAGRDLTEFFDAWLFSADLPDAYPA